MGRQQHSGLRGSVRTLAALGASAALVASLVACTGGGGGGAATEGGAAAGTDDTATFVVGQTAPIELLSPHGFNQS
jgi:hypothetical protein